MTLIRTSEKKKKKKKKISLRHAQVLVCSLSHVRLAVYASRDSISTFETGYRYLLATQTVRAQCYEQPGHVHDITVNTPKQHANYAH
jgi:hypothetical protein